MSDRRHFPQDLLLTYGSTICWATAFDIYRALEQVDEDLDYHCFFVTLCTLVKRGVFVKKPWPAEIIVPTNKGKLPSLYLKVA